MTRRKRAEEGWERARDLARRIAERASPRLADPILLREYLPREPRDAGAVGIGTVRGGVWRALGVVRDLGSMRSVAFLEAREEELAIAGASADDDAEGELEKQVEMLLRVARGDILDYFRVSVLDACFALHDALTQSLEVAGSRYLLGLFGEWDQPPRPGGTGAYVELAGDHAWERMIRLTATPDGTSLSAPSRKRGGRRVTWILTPREFVLELPEIVGTVRRAIEARAGSPSPVVATRADFHRLTPDKLVPGSTYRVLQAFGHLNEAEVVRFVRSDLVRYPGYTIYCFERLSDPRAIFLSEIDPCVSHVFRDIGAYLFREPALARG